MDGDAWRAFVAIGLGAAFGANARYLVSGWAADRFGIRFPVGTLIVNISGSFAIGFVVTLLARRFGGGGDAQLLLATGFLGGYTTFSTFAYETVALLRGSEVGPGLANALGSIVGGIVGAFAGVLLAILVAGSAA
ncbi:MAG: fluoride efflux transporter CrcB [Thermomicrobiales bacterium]|nr:fluoride efflux transporter CrcB [Thermomicrobiales bacterium]